MFSYDTDDRRNRALIQVGESGWSPAQSFEIIGQSFEAILSREYEDDPGEAHLGISVSQGLGQVISEKNNSERSINFRKSSLYGHDSLLKASSMMLYISDNLEQKNMEFSNQAQRKISCF
jgi:SHR-binding domain of vacuolar-sorting associated protein 13